MARTTHKYSLYIVASALTCVAIGAAQCQRAGDATASADRDVHITATAPSAATLPTLFNFDDKKDGVQLQYTSAWTAKPDKDYVLQLVPADASSDRRILFDIPEIPVHIPGMVRIGLVENGYVKDLKESHADAHTESAADRAMGASVKARLVESSWMQDGVAWKNIALLMIRNDNVYILSCRSDPAHAAATRADFDQVVASFHWTK